MNDISKDPTRIFSKVKPIPIPPSVQSLGLFLGWGRSGHSFIGQAVNAHPDVLIANEGKIYDFFDAYPEPEFVYGYMHRLHARFLRKNFTKTPRLGKPQNMFSPGGFQAGSDAPLLIGNSKAANTSRICSDDPERMDRFLAAMGLAPKVLLVTRNPHQMIASHVKRKADDVSSELIDGIRDATKCVQSALSYLEARNYPVKTVVYEDFVANPVDETTEIYAFLGLRAVTYAKLERPADDVPELAAFRDEIDQMIQTFDVFSSYR